MQSEIVLQLCAKIPILSMITWHHPPKISSWVNHRAQLQERNLLASCVEKVIHNNFFVQRDWVKRSHLNDKWFTLFHLFIFNQWTIKEVLYSLLWMPKMKFKSWTDSNRHVVKLDNTRLTIWFHAYAF